MRSRPDRVSVNGRFPDSRAEYGENGVFRGDRVGDSVIMTASNGGADPDARPARRWDVALSFAGAQRDHVGQVAAPLTAQGACCLYDADEQVRLWGTHLAEELPRIYAHEGWWWWCSSPPTMQQGTGPAGTPRRIQPGGCRGRGVRGARPFDDRELPGLLPDVR